MISKDGAICRLFLLVRLVVAAASFLTFFISQSTNHLYLGSADHWKYNEDDNVLGFSHGMNLLEFNDTRRPSTLWPFRTHDYM